MKPAALPGVRERVVGVDAWVPIANGEIRPYINLDNAASTPAFREVLEAVNDCMQWYSSVHRGAGYKSQVATQAYEDARHTVARFVGANDREHVAIFGKNTTEALNKLSYRLPLAPEDVVLVSTLEHHSNDLPWRARCRVVHVRATADGRLDEEHCAQLLQQHAGRVKLLAVTGGSNVTGHMPDVHRLAEMAHAVGAQIVVDCAQRAAHRAIDMRPLSDPAHLDYVAIAGHKMYAPFGVGALIGRRDTFEQGEPELRGGGTVRHVSLDHVSWADAPDRDEAGSPNVAGAMALAAAVKVLQRIGMDAIAQHETDMVAYTLGQLQAVPGLQIYGCSDPLRAHERLGVVPFSLPGVPHALLAAVLSEEHGIGVRNGCFCAQPYLAHLLGLDTAAVRGLQARALREGAVALPGLVRASLGLYTTPREVDALVTALQAVANGEYRRDYVCDPQRGEYRSLGRAAA